MKIATNVQSLVAQGHLKTNGQEYAKETVKLSTGDRIQQAAYDPSGLIISEGMKSRIRSYGQAQRNANDSISLIQVAEGALGSIQSMSSRMKELALQAANDTMSSEDRGYANVEFQQLKKEINRIIKVTKFNGKPLLDGNNRSYTFQVGIRNDAKNDRVQYDLGKIIKGSRISQISSANVSSKFGSMNALPKIDEFLNEVSRGRAFLGSIQNRIGAVTSNLQISEENLARSNSLIRDTDVAKATTKRLREKIKMDASTQTLAHTQDLGKNAQKLVEES